LRSSSLLCATVNFIDGWSRWQILIVIYSKFLDPTEPVEATLNYKLHMNLCFNFYHYFASVRGLGRWGEEEERKATGRTKEIKKERRGGK
jgi:hypothetical protein